MILRHAQRDFGCSETSPEHVKATPDEQGFGRVLPVEEAWTPSRSFPGSRVSARAGSAAPR